MLHKIHSLHPLHTDKRQGLERKEVDKILNANKQRIIKIKGPFNSDNKLVKYISRNHEYKYICVFNNNISDEDIKKLKWSISYDDKKSNDSYYLFSGGNKVNQKEVSINLNSKLAENKFKLYAYFDAPSDNTHIEIYFKKAITFFIGGAGDAELYYGAGPTYIVRDDVQKPFEKIEPKTDFISYYLGYNKAFKSKIQSEIISKIPNKEGVQINIVGHSLGGWNGAHLSQILSDKGYQVDLLVTLDPVGTKVGVTLISDIYWNTPKPKSNYWVNVYISPEDYDGSDFIADIGGQWIPPASKVNYSHIAKTNHWNAGKMFKEILYEHTSASDLLLFWSNLYLNSK